MNWRASHLHRVAVLLLLLIPVNSNCQYDISTDVFPKLYRCSVHNSDRFIVTSDSDWIYCFQAEPVTNSQLYRINALTGQLDSFSFTHPKSQEIALYQMTALDVCHDTLTLCYGDNVYFYHLSSDNKCDYIKHFSLATGEIIFSANLHHGRLYLSCDIPQNGQKHTFKIIDYTSELETSKFQYFTHLANLTTFSPSRYFANSNDTTYYFDSENFQILSIHQNTIDTVLNVRTYFEANNIKFLKATTKINGINEFDNYFLNEFGKFPFDFIHEIYISSTKIFLYYFPANHSATFKLERSLLEIDRTTGLQANYPILRTENHGLIDFQSTLVKDKLFLVSHKEHFIYIEEYPKINSTN